MYILGLGLNAGGGMAASAGTEASWGVGVKRGGASGGVVGGVVVRGGGKL